MLFLGCAAVHRHIAHVQGCHNAGMGYSEMPIQISDGLRRGPTELPGLAELLIRHQEPGQVADIKHKYIYIPNHKFA